MIKLPKKGEYDTLKNHKRKIRSLFIIDADSGSILVPEYNGQQNPDESNIKYQQTNTEKYHKHVAFSYGYKLVCFNEKFSKPFKSYLGKDPV